LFPSFPLRAASTKPNHLWLAEVITWLSLLTFVWKNR
jgi:hypothetical protein